MTEISEKIVPLDSEKCQEREPISHLCGTEYDDLAEHFSFNVGSVIKHCWRAAINAGAIEDLEKARYYVEREIRRRTSMNRDSVDRASAPRKMRVWEFPAGSIE